ncbi:MAG TPA: SDR family oxidoreductase [Tepidisphaeraceae bacterium]|jgi:NAD(P)-dependent dehydrogenase (short-subunit alcohol dehydrogenase family)|nr:SDR family oxidoreductase [Tepidisphaeraceae bacterium]
MAMLEGKSIVIMGGTAGLGESAAAACAREGARLILVGRDDPAAVAARNKFPDAQVIAADARLPETADRAIEEAVRRHGRLDGLYHVAGGSGRSAGDGRLHEITDAGWNATLELNLTPIFLSNRAAVRQFRRQNSGGVVLNMGSVLGFSPSPRFFATHAYAAAKAAVVGFSRSCAAYYAKENIRFNVIAPGLVQTPMTERASNNPAIRQFIAAKQSLAGGRIGLPADLDAAVVLLLSDAGAFITGQVLSVDGGWCVSDGPVSDVAPGGQP